MVFGRTGEGESAVGGEGCPGAAQLQSRAAQQHLHLQQATNKSRANNRIPLPPPKKKKYYLVGITCKRIESEGKEEKDFVLFLAIVIWKNIITDLGCMKFFLSMCTKKPTDE